MSVAPEDLVDFRESGRDSTVSQVFKYIAYNFRQYVSYPFRRAFLRRMLGVAGLVHSTISGPVKCSWAQTLPAYVRLESPGSSPEAKLFDSGHI